MTRIVVPVLLSAAVLLGAVRGYEVVPRQASWSGKAYWQTGVGQGFVACFDSIEAVHLFIGQSEGSAPYQVDIGEPGSPPMMTSFPIQPAKGHDWAVFDSWQTEARFTKGKTYIATFTRTTSPDSLVYYYDSTDAYQWGQIILPGQTVPIPDPRDLCLRVYGVMDAVDPSWMGYILRATPGDQHEHSTEIKDGASIAHPGADRIDLLWQELQPDSGEPFDWDSTDLIVSYSRDTLGCELVGLLCYSAKWASSRIDSTWVWHDGGETLGGYVIDTVVGCPPKNLWTGVWSDSNHWAR